MPKSGRGTGSTKPQKGAGAGKGRGGAGKINRVSAKNAASGKGSQTVPKRGAPRGR